MSVLREGQYHSTLRYIYKNAMTGRLRINTTVKNSALLCSTAALHGKSAHTYLSNDSGKFVAPITTTPSNSL